MKKLFMTIICIAFVSSIEAGNGFVIDTGTYTKGINTQNIYFDTMYFENLGGSRRIWTYGHIFDNNASVFMAGAGGSLKNKFGNTLAIGPYSLQHLKDSVDGNVAVGVYAIYRDSTGIQNTAVGVSAGELLSSGSYNSWFGYTAGYSNMHGNCNVGIGAYALAAGYYDDHKLAALNGNVAIGFRTLDTAKLVTGSIAIGYKAGSGLDTCDTSIFIGYNTGNSSTLQKQKPKHQILVGEGLNNLIDSTAIIVPPFYKSTTIGGRKLYTGTLYLADSSSAPSNTSTPVVWMEVYVTGAGGTYQSYRIPLYQ